MTRGPRVNSAFSVRRGRTFVLSLMRDPVFLAEGRRFTVDLTVNDDRCHPAIGAAESAEDLWHTGSKVRAVLGMLDWWRRQ